MDTGDRIKNQRTHCIFSKLERISTTEDVQILPYLDCIGIENLKIYIAQSLADEIPNNALIINSLYFEVEAIQNILSINTMIAILTFLTAQDIYCSIRVLNKEFNQLLKRRATVHRLFYYHPMLRQLFDKETYGKDCSYRIQRKEPSIRRYTFDGWGDDGSGYMGSKLKYTLQNSYEIEQLNECVKNPEQLSTHLCGHDRVIYNLMSYFDLKMILRGEMGPGELDADDCYVECFEDHRVHIENFQCDYTLDISWTCLNSSINQDGVDGIAVTGYYRHKEWDLPIIPTLFIDIPDDTLRAKIEKSVGASNVKMRATEHRFDPCKGREAIQEFGMWF